MKLTKLIAVTSVAVMGLAGTTLPVQAASHYKRTKTTKVSSKAYYSTSKTGKTYRFSGSAKRTTFKATHALKNYTKTTWTRSKKTTVNKHGKKVLYYYVTNSNRKIKGWVAASYLKAGKNYQATTAKTTKAANYYRGKSAKLVKISGKNSAVKLTNGASLKAHLTYKRIQQRNVYVHGKKATYVYVTSADGKAKGWTKASNLKAGKDYQMTTPIQLGSTDYIMEKAGKVYTLSGTNQAMKFTKGQALTDQDNYTATESRYVYKKNKKQLYYHVSNTDGSVTGWVYANYLKAGKHAITTTTTPTTKPETPVDTSTSHSATSSVSSSTSSTTVSSSSSSVAPVKGDFDGKAEQAMYYHGDTYLYTTPDLNVAKALPTSIPNRAELTIYPEGMHQVAKHKYALPIVFNNQKLYFKITHPTELARDFIYVENGYTQLSDNYYAGTIKPTDSTTKIIGPVLDGAHWTYVGNKKVNGRYEVIGYIYRNGQWTIDQG